MRTGAAELATAILGRERERERLTERKGERSPCMLVCFISHSVPNITDKIEMKLWDAIYRMHHVSCACTTVEVTRDKPSVTLLRLHGGPPSLPCAPCTVVKAYLLSPVSGLSWGKRKREREGETD